MVRECFFVGGWNWSMFTYTLLTLFARKTTKKFRFHCLFHTFPNSLLFNGLHLHLHFLFGNAQKRNFVTQPKIKSRSASEFFYCCLDVCCRSWNFFVIFYNCWIRFEDLSSLDVQKRKSWTNSRNHV